MVVCYKFLYKQKKQNQSDLDRLSRRLSFKFPIVLRFSICFPFLFGLVHGTLAKNLKIMRNHLYTVPLYMTFLCQQEIYQYYQIKTGQQVNWRTRGQNLLQQKIKEDQKKKAIDQQMKLKAQKLAKQVQKPLNSQL